MDDHPCDTCLRWPECNGIDQDTCQLVKAHAEREAAPVRFTVHLDNFSARALARVVEKLTANDLTTLRRRIFYD